MNKPAEKNNLIYKIFNFPLIYNLYQKIIFRKDSKNKIFNEYIKVNKKDLVLDIGCGPGNYRQLIKSENYFGIDINCKSIDQAKEIYPNDNFDCLPVQEISSKLNKNFDKIILLGLLHHISDQDAINLFNDLKNVVMPQSQVFCLDTSFKKNQKFFSKMMAKLDKGNHVRFPEELEKLVDKEFYTIDVKMFDNLLRVPCFHSFIKVSVK
jgi:SAM-dependent methyltransferase